jgi:cell wall-associated NlpC family hydrolase
MIAPGTLLLFRSSGLWYERAIALITHGPYVHVAISLPNGQVIAATPHGIEIGTLTQDMLSLCDSVDLTPYTSKADIQAGLVWAVAQKGKEYGWLDIFYQALKFVWPNNKLRFGVTGEFDCSDFACRYAQQAGVVFPDGWNDPYSMTPNDIGRVFGLIPSRKGHTREVVKTV